MHITDTNHVTLIVADLQATRAFYCEVLGMTEVARPASFHLAAHGIALARQRSM